MTTPLHTFGPWTARFAPNLSAIVTCKGEMQISLHGTHNGLKPLQCNIQEWQANVRLMAMAPELLTECGAALDTLLTDGYGESSHVVMALRAVIEKATRSE